MSKRFFGLGVVVTGLAAMGLAAGGCTTGSTLNQGGGGSGNTTTLTTTGTTLPTTGTGGTGGDVGIHSIDGAQEIAIDDPLTDATLVDAKTSDFYKFTGKAGDRLIIAAFAPGLASGSDPAIVDTTIALIGPNKDVTKPLTYQSDQWPPFGQDAVLFVQLPADGDYYVAVQDCNALFSSGCPQKDPTGITDLEYNLLVAHMDQLVSPEANAGKAQDGTTGKAVAVAYAVPQGGNAGEYGEAFIGGSFQSATDKTHVFSFLPPADTSVTSGSRPRAEFYVQGIGGFQGGDLSASNIKIWATDSTGAIIYSQADQTKYPTTADAYSPMQFSVPVTLGQQYYLFVQNLDAAGDPLKDFYFISHYLNPLIDVAEKETAKGANDTSATAEVLTGQGSGASFFTVDGTLTETGATGDQDWFTFTVPTGTTQFAMQCDAARTGSGLGGFTAEIFGKDGTTSLSKASETADTDLYTPDPVNVPSGTTSLFLKVSAATQDATVVGNSYRCYVFFQ